MDCAAGGLYDWGLLPFYDPLRVYCIPVPTYLHGGGGGS